jgi:hypothetical protein
MEKKYRIAFDYGAYEGLKIQEGSFASVDEAVKYAVGMNYATPFIIITIEWTPEGKTY